MSAIPCGFAVRHAPRVKSGMSIDFDLLLTEVSVS
jgi:hypothetical protein